MKMCGVPTLRTFDGGYTAYRPCENECVEGADVCADHQPQTKFDGRVDA